MTSEDNPEALEDLSPLFLVAAQKTILPSDVFDSLQKIIHKLMHDSNRVDYAKHLAGRIFNGEQIEATRSLDPILKMYFCASGRQYIKKMAKLNRVSILDNFKVNFKDCWIVVSKSGDYNPIHFHNTQLSGVVYIEIPSSMDLNQGSDGNLAFIFGQTSAINLDFMGAKEVEPVVGEMYVFPSWLQHVVYPFHGQGRRISFAFNLNVENIEFPRA